MLEFYKSTKNPKTALPAERLWTEDTMYPLIITGRVQTSRILDASIELLAIIKKKQRNKKEKKNLTRPKPEDATLYRRLSLTV